MSAGPRIALVHAHAESMAPIAEAFAAGWPEAEIFNLLDDSLARDVSRDGKITTQMTQRFVTLTRYAVSTGARAVQFTCTAFNSCIEAARSTVDVPVLTPDEAMIDDALTHGPRLGVVVTFGPSIDSVTAQIAARSEAMGVYPQVDIRLAEGALEALQRGEGQDHDQRVAAAVSELGPCDIVMLAQYSMARARARVQAPNGVPVLTAPRAAVARLRGLLG